MVAVTEAGKRLVGHIAKRQAITNAENTVYAAKRLIGRKWNSPQVKNAVATSSYRIVEGPHRDVRIVAPRQGVQRPRDQRDGPAGDEGHRRGLPRRDRSSKAVITVPAYFNDNQRQATSDAGEIAGLDVIRIINEPTAAALAYGLRAEPREGRRRLRLRRRHVRHLDPRDRRARRLQGHRDRGRHVPRRRGRGRARSSTGSSQGFKEEHSIDLRQDRMALQRLKDAAEKAKCELSSVRETEVNLPFIISSGRNEALHLQRALTRDDARGAERGPHRADGRHLPADARGRASSRRTRSTRSLLVGGMTRMPKIQQAVAEFFEREPCKGVHPDEVVALGAAIQGSALARRQAGDDPPRRHAARARHHDARQLLRGAHPAEHDGADAPHEDLHDEPRQPDGGEDPRHAGGERERRGERAARRVHPHRAAPRARRGRSRSRSPSRSTPTAS